jgi:hypothetical protein
MNVALKIITIIALSLWTGLCALTATAASDAEAGVRAVATADIIEATDAKARVLNAAAREIEGSWARPLTWHAGVTESLAGIYAALADIGPAPATLDAAAYWSERTVRMAPVQPRAWVRLAQLGEAGHPRAVCTPPECLNNSWAVAPVMDLEPACVRLRVAAQHQTIAPSDPRIGWALASMRLKRQAATCLSFLPPAELFHILLESELR